MSQYKPSREDIERLLDSREEQGHPRKVSDPAVLAPIASLLRPHLEERARDEQHPEEGAA